MTIIDLIGKTITATKDTENGLELSFSDNTRVIPWQKTDKYGTHEQTYVEQIEKLEPL